MLNSVSLEGRLVADPVAQTIQKQEKQITIARYRLAVERDYKEGEHRPVDYIFCKAFGTDALFVQKYFQKGDTVIVSGRIISEPYKKDGKESAGFFTGVLVRKNYLARKAGESAARTRAMTPQQDGEKNLQEHPANSQEYLQFPTLQEEYSELPPLPEEDEYTQAYLDMDISLM